MAKTKCALGTRCGALPGVRGLSTVMSMTRGMMMGMICWRSRICTMTEDTKSTSPTMNGISMATYSGAHNEASFGREAVDGEEDGQGHRGHERREGRPQDLRQREALPGEVALGHEGLVGHEGVRAPADGPAEEARR